MRRQRYLLWVVCCLATLVSCSRDDQMAADDVIRFDNRIWEQYVSDLTRGTVTDNDNLAEFGVFAYYSASGLYNAHDSKPDYMYNVHATRSEREWTYLPLKFWPQGSVSFFAYSPYADINTEISVECITGAPVVTYAVPDDVTAHRDLLLSAPAHNKTQDDGAVMLIFRHVLACLDFNARVDSALTTGESIKVTALHVGSFQHKAACHHELESAVTQNFTSDASDKTYTLSEENASLVDLSLTTTNQRITSANGSPMLWPQEINAADKLTVTAQYISKGKTREIVFEKNILPFTTMIEAGKRYIFTMVFTPLTEMSLVCTVVEWEKEIIDVPDFN